MKIIRSLTLLAAAGALLVPTWSAYAEGAVRTNTSGHLIDPLDLGDPLFTGTVAPARLGTGTPTSATVLRGDGSWAGTTSTGNTVASTGSLLMGDGAGNAVAVPDGVNLLSVLKTRLETRAATAAPVVNLLAGRVPNSGTINSDGTITIPASGRVYWQGIPNANGGSASTTYYGYVVALGEAVPGALNLHVGIGYDVASTDSTIAPGVYRSVTTSTADGFAFIVNNTTAAPITIYFPAVAPADGGLSLIVSGADQTAVPTQPVADLDFTRFSSADRSGRYQSEKLTTLAADSVNGSSGNAGSLYAPKLTLQQTITNGATFGLYRGSLFRDSLPLSTLGTTHGIAVQDVGLGQPKPLPIVSALDVAPNGSFTANGDGTFSYLWTPAEAIVNDGYSNVYAVEINTTTEAATPIAARRRMVDVTAAGGATGTVWIQGPGTGTGQSGSTTQWRAIIHPSDSHAPGSGIYRYEVVSRVQPANWGTFDSNPGDGLMSGLQLVGGSSGYGSLGAPRGFVGDRLAIIHSTTHNAVIGGGSLQRSVFYEAGNLAQNIQLAWYAGQGAGLRWDLRHCLFYANVGDRPANCLLSHTAGSNFDRGDISDCAFLGARWAADASLRGTAIEYDNVATGIIERVYIYGISTPFGALPAGSEVRNCVLQQVGQTIVNENFHDNIVAAESPNYGGQNARGFLLENAGQAHNNLFWARGVGSGAQVNGFYSYNPSGAAASQNIIVLDPSSPATVAAYCQGTLTSIAVDYNLILCTGQFSAPGPGPGYTTFASYQAAYPTLDQHSMFIDLSADPRGLKAVFADPANGDFRWAQTDVARRCAAYCRANNVGPATVTSRWPVVPTVDEAVRLLTGL